MNWSYPDGVFDRDEHGNYKDDPISRAIRDDTLWDHPKMREYFESEYDEKTWEFKHDLTRVSINTRYTAHPCVALGRAMTDIRFKHVPWDKVAELIRISLDDGRYSDRWEDWSKNNPCRNDWRFVHFKSGNWYGPDDPRPLCDEQAFYSGIERCFGTCCVLCDEVSFERNPDIRIEPFLRPRFKNQTIEQMEWAPLCCSECSGDFGSFMLRNKKLTKEAHKKITTFRQLRERQDAAYRAELKPIRGKGSRKARAALDAIRLSQTDTSHQESLVWESLVLCWLTDRLAQNALQIAA